MKDKEYKNWLEKIGVKASRRGLKILKHKAMYSLTVKTNAGKVQDKKV